MTGLMNEVGRVALAATDSTPPLPRNSQPVCENAGSGLERRTPEHTHDVPPRQGGDNHDGRVPAEVDARIRDRDGVLGETHGGAPTRPG